jgi:hypothetical protein
VPNPNLTIRNFFIAVRGAPRAGLRTRRFTSPAAGCYHDTHRLSQHSLTDNLLSH